MKKNKQVKITIISKDHILLEKHCGCKLHLFITDQYEEPCKKHKLRHLESSFMD